MVSDTNTNAVPEERFRPRGAPSEGTGGPTSSGSGCGAESTAPSHSDDQVPSSQEGSPPDALTAEESEEFDKFKQRLKFLRKPPFGPTISHGSTRGPPRSLPPSLQFSNPSAGGTTSRTTGQMTPSSNSDNIKSSRVDDAKGHESNNDDDSEGDADWVEIDSESAVKADGDDQTWVKVENDGYMRGESEESCKDE